MTEHEPIEIESLRTENGKTSYVGGWRYRLALSVAPVHVPDGAGGWLDPELDFVPCAGGLRVRRALFDTFVPERGVRAAFRHPGGGRAEVELELAGGVRPALVAPAACGREVRWEDAAPGLTVRLRSDLHRAELFKDLASPAAPRTLRWKVTADAPGRRRFGLLPRLWGADAAGVPLELTQESTPPREARPGVWEWRVTETFTGRTVPRDPRTRVKRRAPEADTAYPVCIDPTVTLNVNASSDNGNGDTGAATWSNVGQNNAGYYGASQRAYSSSSLQQAGFRFTNATVPQGATVSSATFSTTVRKINTSAGGALTGGVYGDKVANAAAWSNTSRPDQIAKTAAKGTFADPAGSGLVTIPVSIDLTSVVQEIVNQGAWASGNAMRFGWLCTYSAPGSRRLYYGTVGDHYADTPQLTVTYSAASGAALDDEGVLYATSVQW